MEKLGTTRSDISGAVALGLIWVSGPGPALAQAAVAPPTSSPPSAEATATAPAVTAGPVAADAGKVEEIVVTAQFREQNLQKTPIAITAISGSMLQARSQTNIAQIAAQSPSVTLTPGNAAYGPSLVATIRGVGQSDYIPAVEPGVGLYVDDVYYATLTGSILDLLDLDRVEILRGPQGTLAGRNSIGGAIKLYSKRPTGSTEGLVQATYGSRDRLDLRGSLNFALAPDLDGRVAGVAKKQKGYIKDYDYGCRNPPGSPNNPAVGGIAPLNPIGSSCLLDRFGEVNYQAVRGQLRYHPSDAIDINLIGDYTHEDRAPAGTILTFTAPEPKAVQAGTLVPFDDRFKCGRRCTYANGYGPSDPANGVPYATTRKPFTAFDGFGFSLEGEFRLSDALKLTSITAYREYDAPFMSDDDASPFPVSNTYQDLRFHFFSQEMRLNGSFADGRFLYTVGGYYSSQLTRFLAILDIRAASLQFSSPDDRIPSHSKAGFANASWTITDQLTLNGGLRYTSEDKDYKFTRRFPDGTLGQPLVGSLEGVVGRYKGNRVDYRANLQYQWSPGVMTYAQFSTGFKGGGINARPFFPSQAQPFSPESIKAFEVGAKTDLFDRRMRVNVSAFFNQYSNIQLNLTTCPQYNPPGIPQSVLLPCQATANAGNAHVKGAELETSIRPVDGLVIDGSLSYVDFNYTSLTPTVSFGPTGVLPGDVAPYLSKWKWSIGAQYSAMLGSGGSVTPRVDLSYQSRFFTLGDNAPTSRVPGYFLANARLTWRNARRDLDVSLEGTNLFNKYYFTNIFDNSANEGFAVAQPGRPREWALTVTKRF